MIVHRILAAILALYCAGVLAAVLLPPDVLTQFFFLLPAAMYFYAGFRHLIRRIARKSGKGCDEPPTRQPASRVWVIDGGAVAFGAALIYFGATGRTFSQYEDAFDLDLGPSIFPAYEIWTMICGGILLAVGFARIIAWQRRKE